MLRRILITGLAALAAAKQGFTVLVEGAHGS
jgi:hypothetical protein